MPTPFNDLLPFIKYVECVIQDAEGRKLSVITRNPDAMALVLKTIFNHDYIYHPDHVSYGEDGCGELKAYFPRGLMQ